MFDHRNGNPSNDESPGGSPVRWLRALGDRESLYQIVSQAGDSEEGLEAAEALAEMGDVRGLDRLISALDSPRLELREMAAEMIEDINHPRGLRALEQHSESRQQDGESRRSVQPDPARSEEIYRDLSSARTDELVSFWHERDRHHRSDEEYEMIQSILVERLGKLPVEPGSAGGGADQEVDESIDARIQGLWRDRDVDALIRVVEEDPSPRLQLEAAEALAHLGNRDALDFLIDSLDADDKSVSDLAAQILDWLDIPRGRAALAKRGIEFEQDTDEPSSIPRDSWLAERAPGPAAGMQTGPIASVSGTSQSEAPARSSFSAILTGAAGGVVGFILLQLGLHALGLRSFLSDPAEWLQVGMLYLLIESAIVGGAAGNIGRRLVLSLRGPAEAAFDDGDAPLVLAALFSGAAAAVGVGVVRYLFGA